MDLYVSFSIRLQGLLSSLSTGTNWPFHYTNVIHIICRAAAEDRFRREPIAAGQLLRTDSGGNLLRPVRSLGRFYGGSRPQTKCRICRHISVGTNPVECRPPNGIISVSNHSSPPHTQIVISKLLLSWMLTLLDFIPLLLTSFTSQRYTSFSCKRCTNFTSQSCTYLTSQYFNSFTRKSLHPDSK
jgi:hypothetical protein